MARSRSPGKMPPKRRSIAGGNPAGDYPVGYRKPPVASRFKKGVSGNPKGRPRPKPDIHAIMRDALFKRVVVREKGRIRKIPYLEALLRKAQADAINGSLKPLMELVKFCHLSGLVSFDQLSEPQRTTFRVVFVDPEQKKPPDTEE